jgi:hypothetical protein
VYARVIDGVEYKFGVSGKLYRNGLIMYDDVTESLWSHVAGRAIVGELAGTRLELVSAVHTDWATWKGLYPDTLVIAKSKSSFSQDTLGFDPYEAYYRDGSPGVLGRANQDERLPVKQHVIGLRVGDQAKAYPFSALNDEPVVNDELAGLPVAVFFHASSASGVVFDRRLGDRVFTFHPGGGADGQDLLVVDEETNTLWRALTGEAVRGPLTGERLTPIPITQVFWFGWVDYYPQTLVYGQDEI